MVCYCPLSVLSVPESILNEGQLHLAAIFQLSSRCHGDPVVSWWTCQESKEELGGGGANAAGGWGVRAGSERKAKGQGQGNVTKERTAWSWLTILCFHLINQPFPKHNLYSSGPTQRILLCISSQLKFYSSWVDVEFWDNRRFLPSAPSLSPHTCPPWFHPHLVVNLREWLWISQSPTFRIQKPASSRTSIPGLCPTYMFSLEGICFFQRIINYLNLHRVFETSECFPIRNFNIRDSLQIRVGDLAWETSIDPKWWALRTRNLILCPKGAATLVPLEEQEPGWPGLRIFQQNPEIYFWIKLFSFV